MEIIINNIKDYSKEKRTLVINDNEICLIEGESCYRNILSKDIDFILDIESKFSKIIFGWKEEYIGSRMVDGEKYHIVVDVNHKKKKYKIQNKFPSNWDEFLKLQDEIMEGLKNE